MKGSAIENTPLSYRSQFYAAPGMPVQTMATSDIKAKTETESTNNGLPSAQHQFIGNSQVAQEHAPALSARSANILSPSKVKKEDANGTPVKNVSVNRSSDPSPTKVTPSKAPKIVSGKA